MQYWIISDSASLSQRIRSAILQMGLECPSPQILPLAAVRNLSLLSEADGIVFVGMPTVGDGEIEIIENIRSLSQARLVVVSSTVDNTTILNIIRAGALDYLNEANDLSHEVSLCLARLEHGRSRPKPRAHTISIVPCHVSSDASILATNLSAAIATECGSCCLLDFQLRGGDLALLLKLEPTHTIYDLVSQSQTADEVMFQHALVPHESGIRLLAGPKLFSDLRGIEPSACNELVLHAQRLFSYVVVATEDIQHSEQIFALTKSDHVLVTMRPDLMSLHRAKLHVEFLLAHDISVDRIQVVVMGVGIPSELPVSAIKKVLSGVTIHTIPDDSASMTLSINVGNPAVLESPRSPAARGMAKLASVLTGRAAAAPGEHRGATAATKAAALLAFHALPFCK